MRWLAICLAATSLWLCSPAYSWPSEHDPRIRAAAKSYLPGVDWRLWWAQLYAESRLNPDAVSPVGAMGCAQFMPATWAQEAAELGVTGSPFDCGLAIKVGAYYMHQLRQEWSAPRPDADRHSLAMASYNAGLGPILEAQRRCDGKNLYAEIVPCLSIRETKDYVRRIWRYYVRRVIR